MNHIEKDPLQRRLEITNWLIFLFLVACSAPFTSAKFTFGIACGGLISIVNFHWLYRNLRSVLRRPSGGVRAAIMIRYYIRFVATGVVLFFVISRYLVDVIGLIIGLSVVVINIVATVIVMLSKKNRPEEVDIQNGTPVDS